MTDAIPLVSVCIANYNGMEVIDDCIRSVRDQLGGIPVEILVHDDASTDDSAAYIRDHYPETKLTVSESNVGFCIANNRMATQARGKYLLLLNNDAALYPDALRTLYAEANRQEVAAILTLPQFDTASGTLVDRGCLLDPFFNPVPNLEPDRQDVAMVIGACLWIPKTVWDELEGFPVWFESIAEDMYLCCRARLSGYAVKALMTSGYTHWQGKSFGGNKINSDRLMTTFRRRALSERNKTYVMVTTCPAPVLLLLLPIHLVVLLLEGVLLSLLNLRVAYLARIYLPVLSAIARRSALLRDARAVVQTSRQVDRTTFFSPFVLLPYKLIMLMRHGIPRVH